MKFRWKGKIRNAHALALKQCSGIWATVERGGTVVKRVSTPYDS